MDLIMLVVAEGSSRTLEQFRALAERARLELVGYKATPSGLCVIECAAPIDA